MSLIDAVKKVGHVFHVIADHIASGFKALFGSDQAVAFAKASLELLKSAAGQIAVEVVTQLEAQQMAGIDKRAIAFSQITAKAAEVGLTVAASEVNLLIELVVTALRQHFLPPVPSEAPPSQG